MSDSSTHEIILLRTLGIIGMAIFIPLFMLTFADPQLIEKSGKAFIEWRLKDETIQKIDSLKPPQESRLESLLGAKAKELRVKTEAKLEEVKRQLKADAPAILAEEIAKLRNLDCECRKQWENSLRGYMESRILSLEKAREKVVDFTHAKYMEIVEKLTLDVRIFLGANSLVFAFLLLASFLKPLAVKQLFLPGGLLILSTAICSYFYLFEQNWFYTIIYGDYTGFAYIGYLVFVFAVLCDIVFNRARVTTEVLNACLQALGQAANLIPC
jgi:hypothetical protein